MPCMTNAKTTIIVAPQKTFEIVFSNTPLHINAPTWIQLIRRITWVISKNTVERKEEICIDVPFNITFRLTLLTSLSPWRTDILWNLQTSEWLSNWNLFRISQFSWCSQKSVKNEGQLVRKYTQIPGVCCWFVYSQHSGVFSKWSRTFSEFSEFRESEESLKHELGSI